MMNQPSLLGYTGIYLSLANKRCREKMHGNNSHFWCITKKGPSTPQMYVVLCEIYHLPEKQAFYSQKGMRSEPQFLAQEPRLRFSLMKRMGGEPPVWVASSGASTYCPCLSRPQSDQEGWDQTRDWKYEGAKDAGAWGLESIHREMAFPLLPDMPFSFSFSLILPLDLLPPPK